MPEYDQLLHAAMAKLERRAMFKKAGTGLAGAIAAATLAGAAIAPGTAEAASAVIPSTAPPTQTDVDILNFALNLEYVEAQFYLNATTGTGLSANDLAGGTATASTTAPGGYTFGTPGAAPIPAGNTLVPWQTPIVQQYADNIAADEQAHVRFIKSALASLGGGIVPAPVLDVSAAGAFTTLATAANSLAGSAVLPTPFNPYASENYFLVGGFIFEDVGVTAYGGAAGLISMGSELVQYAASILAIEAYHAATLRTLLAIRGGSAVTDAIANLRSTLSSGAEYSSAQADDVGTFDPINNVAVVAPRDSNALAFRRSVQQVLNIVYGNSGTARTAGLFFPQGLNQLAGQTGFA